MVYYLCFDLGTTKIKSSLIDDNGQIVYLSSLDSKTYYDNGIYQKPEDFFNTVINEINLMKEKHPGEFKQVEKFICSGQMGGVLGVDEDWNVVFPWTFSLDNRFNTYLKCIEENIGELVRFRSGGYAFGAGKILWIKNDFPRIFKKIKKFINLVTYVSGKICNLNIKDAFIDYSSSSLWGLANIHNGMLDFEICKNCKINMNKLPNILKPFETIGYIKKDVFNTNKDIEVLVGCGDQIAGFFGSGIINNNDLVDVSGTYNVLGYCSNKLKIDLKNKVFTSSYSGIDDIFYQMAVITAGGYVYKWFIEKFNYKPVLDFNNYEGSKGLFFIPYIGGRYHPFQPYYDGTWLGIKFNHDLNDFYAAILESFGYELNFYLELLKDLNGFNIKDIKSIKVIGGGSEDNFWNNIKANILNLNYLRLNKIPYEIIGLFLIAKYKNNLREGFYKLLKDGIIYTEETIIPKNNKVMEYSKNKVNYLKIINELGKIYYQIKKINN